MPEDPCRRKTVTMKYIFGTKEFRTQAEAKKWWSAWLKLNLMRSFTESSDSWPALLELLKRHPSHASACPISFSVQPNQFGDPELRFYTYDGGFHIFSTATAVTGRAKTVESQLIAAMREAVHLQVAKVRLEHAADVCGWCGDAMGGAVTHVDHVTPFNQLAKEFIMSWEGPLPDEVTSSKTQGGCPSFHPKDTAFRLAWVEFHYRRAEMRLLHAACNLQRGHKLALNKHQK